MLDCVVDDLLMVVVLLRNIFLPFWFGVGHFWTRVLCTMRCVFYGVGRFWHSAMLGCAFSDRFVSRTIKAWDLLIAGMCSGYRNPVLVHGGYTYEVHTL